MSKELNDLLKKAYNEYRDVPNPPVPIKEIKEYLELKEIEVNSKPLK